MTNSLFSRFRQYQAPAATMKVYFFSAAKIASIASLKKLDAVHLIFVGQNTALASSASVERVFSVAVDIFTKKRGKIYNETFENQI